MGRNRRMPPLFEVMRQTNPGSPQPGSGPATPGQPDPARNQAFFRAQSQGAQPESVGTAALRLTSTPDAEGETPRAAPAAAIPAVAKPVEVRVGQARRNWVVEDTSARGGPAGESDESSADAPTPPRVGRTLPVKSTLPIPGTWLAVGAAVVLTLIVVVWIVAYRQGSSAKEQEFQGKLSSSAPAGPSTPTKSPGVINPTPPGPSGGTPAPAPTPPEHRPAREPEGTPPVKPEPGPGAKPPQVQTAPAAGDPAPSVDPRQAETNYLSVLTFRSKDEAVELAKYLTAGGLPAATVALKASGGTAAVGWEVFVLQGIPSVDFRRADDRRNAIHRKLEELGKKWNQDGKSRLNFSRDNVTWRKFKPGS